MVSLKLEVGCRWKEGVSNYGMPLRGRRPETPLESLTRAALVERERLDWTGMKKTISLWKNRGAGEDARDGDGRKYLSFFVCFKL